MTITTRAAKGSELTWAELDANFTSLQAAINFLFPSDVAYATAIPLTGNLFMPQQTVSGAIAFTVGSSPVKGANTYLRLVANGTNMPTFTGMREWGGSAGYDNRLGIINQINFFYDGNDYWYSVSQEVGASAIDVTAPTANSSLVANAAPTVVVITMSESMDPAYVPAAGAFTVSGHTVSSVGISGNTISLTVSAAFVYGEAARTAAYTQPGTNNARDLAGNLLANFSSLAIANNVVAVATGVTMSGPTSGTVSSASSNFSLGVTPGGGAITGTVVVTPADGGAGGTFTPTTVSLTSGSPTGTFTYTAASAGAKTISVTNNGGLTNPSNITYTASATSTAPAQVTGLTLGTATTTTQPLSWTAPANGGSAITDYVVQHSPAGAGTWTTFADGTSAATSTTVTGLTASTSYDYRVAAVNAIGTGTYSATATGSTAAAATAPGVPTIGTATAGNASASVAFTAPGSNGGSAITGYTATSSPGGLTGTGASSPITVSGLTNGTAYTFTVTATNAIGTGSASASSNSVTPAAAGSIRLTTRTANQTESGSGPYTYTTNGDPYVSGTPMGGIADVALQSGVDGSLSMKFTNFIGTPGNGSEAILGVLAGTSVVGFGSLPYAIYTQRGTGRYLPFTNGASQTATNLVTAVDGDIVRMRRTGSSVIAEVSKDSGSTWTTLYTWTGISTGVMRFQCVIGSASGGTIHTFTGVGLA